jgi:lactoylglutathione lyase
MRRYAFAVLSVLSLLTPMGSAFGAPAPAGVSPTLSVLSTGMRSSNLDRSIRFYTQGLSMTVLTTRDAGPVTEVIFGFQDSHERPGLMVFQKKGATDSSASVDHGNSEMKVVLAVSDVAALAARLRAAGYAVGEIKESGPYKILWVEDPDGYKYEIVQRP